MSVSTWKEGSSAANLARPVDIFSWSFFDLGSTAISITGLGKVIVSKTTGFNGSHKVSPVVVSFIPAKATISPAKASSISSLLFECIIIILPTRSFFPFVEFNKASPFLIDPE